MKRNVIALYAVVFAVIAASCRKEAPPEEQSGFDHVSTSSEMKVPDGFAFTTTRMVNYDFSTTDIWGKEKIRIDIFDQLPTAGGEIIISSFADGYGALTGQAEVPANLKKMYVVMTTPDGSSSMAVVPVQGGSASHFFGPSTKASKKSTVVSPTCNSGCAKSINNHSGNYDINGNDPGGVYCFTGSISGSINVNNGNVTVRICGNANMQNLSLNSGSKLELTDGASLTINNLNLNSSNGSITVYDATLDINGSFNPSGALTNHGNISMNSLNINGLASVVNNGTLDIANNLDNNYQLTNNHLIEVGNNFTLNSSSVTINNCFIDVDNNATFNNTFKNYGLLRSDASVTLNSGGATDLYDGAMMMANDAVLNSALTGNGTTSLFKVSGNTTINGGGSLNGNLEYCDANGVETNWGSINSPAVLACNVYIPSSACNPVGHGTPQIVDSDNDGVADDVDLYPNDPNASGATSYPANGSYATLAFEDLWPARGDYDFNDLVLDYRHVMVTNADNEVVRIESEYVTRAIGASFNKGFGFQFNLSPSAIASVTGQKITGSDLSLMGNGTEQGQSKATVIVFDNAFRTVKNVGGTAFVNTDPSEAIKEPDTLNTVITFGSAQPISNLGAAPFNPFIYIRNDRGKELHLIDQEPTDLVDPSFFGNASDASNPGSGDYYKTEENHPWALNVIGGFDYPTEKTDIVEAYTYFDLWAQSGGASHTDWFMDFPGYRAAAKVY